MYSKEDWLRLWEQPNHINNNAENPSVYELCCGINIDAHSIIDQLLLSRIDDNKFNIHGLITWRGGISHKDGVRFIVDVPEEYVRNGHYSVIADLINSRVNGNVVTGDLVEHAFNMLGVTATATDVTKLKFDGLNSSNILQTLSPKIYEKYFCVIPQTDKVLFTYDTNKPYPNGDFENKWPEKFGFNFIDYSENANGYIVVEDELYTYRCGRNKRLYLFGPCSPEYVARDVCLNLRIIEAVEKNNDVSLNEFCREFRSLEEIYNFNAIKKYLVPDDVFSSNSHHIPEDNSIIWDDDFWYKLKDKNCLTECLYSFDKQTDKSKRTYIRIDQNAIELNRETKEYCEKHNIHVIYLEKVNSTIPTTRVFWDFITEQHILDWYEEGYGSADDAETIWMRRNTPICED